MFKKYDSKSETFPNSALNIVNKYKIVNLVFSILTTPRER
jgi:hypothetical protein